MHQRNVDCALQADFVEIAVFRVHEAAELGHVRTDVGDVERTCRGVAAEQRALRPAQHFDPLDVDEFAQRHAGARLVGTVDEDADGAFEADIVRRGTDAAHAQHDRARSELGLACGEAGRQCRDLLDVDDALRFKLLRRDGGHRQRNVLHVLRTAGRRHDDYVVVPYRGSIALGVLGKGGGGKRAAGHQAASEDCELACHIIPLSTILPAWRRSRVCELKPIRVARPNKSHRQVLTNSSINATYCAATQHQSVVMMYSRNFITHLA